MNKINLRYTIGDTVPEAFYFKVTRVKDSQVEWPKFYLKGFHIDYTQVNPTIRFYRIIPEVQITGVTHQVGNAVFKCAVEDFKITKLDSKFAALIASSQFIKEQK